jgi:hypothetical protein
MKFTNLVFYDQISIFLGTNSVNYISIDFIKFDIINYNIIFIFFDFISIIKD